MAGKVGEERQFLLHRTVPGSHFLGTGLTDSGEKPLFLGLGIEIVKGRGRIIEGFNQFGGWPLPSL